MSFRSFVSLTSPFVVLAFGGCGQSTAPSTPTAGTSSSSAGQTNASGGMTQAGAGGGNSGNATAGSVASSGASAGTPSGAAGAGGSAGASAIGGAGVGAGGNAGSSSGTGCTGKTICWDFETGKIPDGWTKRFDQPSGELLVDDTKAYGTSKYSLHAKDIVGNQPQKSIIYQLPAAFGPVLWGRMHLFTAGTQPASHAGFFAAYYPPVGASSTSMTTLDWYEVASYTQAYMSIWHPPWPPGFPESVQVSDTKLVLDKWTCVEWQFDGKNDADPMEAAEPRTWLDGAELAWPTKFAFSDTNQQNEMQPKRAKAGNFTVIETGITMWQSMPTPNNWWIDDLAVGPERIGCN